MVYWYLLSAENGIARYSIGADTDDITGVLRIDANNHEYVIEKEPDRIPLYIRHVDSMIHRNSKLFANGSFPERLSHQIG